MPEPGDEWRRRYERERAARLEAEAIAEQAIADLYASNRELDHRVRERTAELAIALDQAEAAGEAKSVFLHGLAHELSTPLHAIAGLAELLRGRVADPEVEATVVEIEGAATRLHRVLRTLVEFAAASGGDLAMRPAPIELGVYAEQVVRRWRRAAAQRGMLLEVEVRPDPSARVTVDATRLDQVVDAVVDNAVRHGGGGILAEVEATADQRLRVRVTDEGPGFDPALGGEVFDAFVRGDASGEGLGIGLTLAAAVAAAMGGEVSVLPSSTGVVVEISVPVPDG